MNNPDQKNVWKKSYSLILLCNAAYIFIFYFIMQLFS